MVNAQRDRRQGRRRSGGSGRGRGSQAGPPQREVVKTIAFDSVGDRKYALQIQKAKNGNPCLRLVEGRPQEDGTYRKFDLRIWSEDWASFFRVVDEMRAFIDQNNIRTPPGHKYTPRKRGERPN